MFSVEAGLITTYRKGGLMLKKICSLTVICTFVFVISGCGALIGTALSAAAAYGIYSATKK